MRRAVLTLGGTAAGIAALLAFKFQPATSVTPLAGTVVPSSAGAASATTGTAAGKPAATSSGGTAAGGNAAGGTAQSAGGQVFTGAVNNTSYGPMQVAITVAGKKITKVTVVQQTNTGGTSVSIDAMAIPKLTTEALAAQSAKIDAVSGASYTSQGYISSLQSAIDKAKL